jgi:hypothetical protein
LFNIERNLLFKPPIIHLQNKSSSEAKLDALDLNGWGQSWRRVMVQTIIIILIVLWLLGLIGNIGGSMIHALLVIAAIVLVYNLVTGRRA